MWLVRAGPMFLSPWSGEEPRNALFRGPITATLKEKYDINLRIVPYSDTVEIVNKLINEKSAGRHRGGSVDMVWINGENFASPAGGCSVGTLRRLTPERHFLSGNRAKPRLRDTRRRIRSSLAARPIRSRLGHRAIPVATGVARSPAPMDQIAPCRFTYIAPPGYTSVFVRRPATTAMAPCVQKFDEDHYVRASSKAIAFLNDIKPYLWRKGETCPSSLRELNRLFANGEVDFSAVTVPHSRLWP